MNILLIEDDEFYRRRLTEQIRSLVPDAHVQYCDRDAGVQSLLARIATGHFDFLFVDQNLPGIQGTELLRLLRSVPRRHGCKTVMLTGTFDDNAKWDALVNGADGFMEKPVSMARLRKVLVERNVHWELRDLPRNLNVYHEKRRAMSA